MEFPLTTAVRANRSRTSSVPTGLRVRVVCERTPGYYLLPPHGMLTRHSAARPDQRTASRDEVWPAISPLLEQVWARSALGARIGAPPTVAATQADMESLLASAELTGVCSFAQTLEAATQYLLGEDGRCVQALASTAIGESVAFDSIRGLTLEPMDAGHTAGVIRLGITFTHRVPQWIALLVARDLGSAASRLGAMASDLRVWHRMSPSRATQVLDLGSGSIRWFGQQREVFIAATRWIEGRSLHSVAAAPAPTLCSRDGSAKDDRDALYQQLAQTRSALATFAIDGACERTIDLRQGDVLAGADGSVVLVGSAARSWWGALGAWPYRLAALRWAGAALPVDASVRSAALQQVIADVQTGLAVVRDRRDGLELLTVMLRQARDLDLSHRAIEGVVDSGDHTSLISAVQKAIAQTRRRG